MGQEPDLPALLDDRFIVSAGLGGYFRLVYPQIQPFQALDARHEF
jgi:hypothetical protein